MPPEPTETQGRDYDVLVIGAGINGTSAARELVGSGFRTLLVEKGDFASGASSRSSRILHCGLRYFETPNPVRTFAVHPFRFAGALSMARAAMQARAELADSVPERCNPITMCFPVYRDSSVRAWHIDLGFILLRAIGPSKPPLSYRRLTRDFERHLPFAAHLRDRHQLVSVATYREYVMDWPDRLCVDTGLEAEQIGADLKLFCEVVSLRRQAGKWCAQLVDLHGGHEQEISARVVLNMAGTWIDSVKDRSEGPATPRLITGTKGAHIAVRLPKAYEGFGITTLHRGGMPFYCLPSHDDIFYFGPTETLFDGDAGDVSATDADIDFLIGEANHLLPGLQLSRRDVVFTWAGVRPLTHDAGQPMGRRTREIHDLASAGMPGMFAMTAGPVMSHLSAGREICTVVEKYLGASRHSSAWRGRPCEMQRVGHGIARPISTDRPASFRNAVATEHARDLKGILYTRTGLAWRGHLEREDVEEAAGAVSELAGWSPERTVREVNDFLRYQKTVFRTASDPEQNNATTSEMGDVQA
ncbi:FAD-dependent oxidoreductase [Nitratireductor indicus]|uniref:FAD-dependent oxidoreductase n=1 Tax=Nitratireductor indicus TaxID=721133 RepID=UPI002874048F|nr:FAD-dependent oxidoreductase [Nitratireductor indicus]MDS1138376.1 FAD-dependent oxidoreductase [Nitratireductor indicus]